MRTNVELDEELLNKAFRYSKAKTKKSLLQEALQELIAAREKLDLRDLKGKITFQKDYDYKKLRRGNEMVLVDTSVLIDFLSAVENSGTRTFQSILDSGIAYGITTFTYMEVLQGVRTEREFGAGEALSGHPAVRRIPG